MFTRVVEMTSKPGKERVSFLQVVLYAGAGEGRKENYATVANCKLFGCE